MPTLRQSARLLPLLCLLASWRAEAHPVGSGGAKAPVSLALAGVRSGDALTLTLTIQAASDIPRAVARFVLPKGLTPVSGPAVQELGPLAGGETVSASLRVRLLASAPSPRVFAGVDCHQASGVRLHASAEWPPGGPPKASRPRPLAGTRATPARRRL
jgi:hypothetical protein